MNAKTKLNHIFASTSMVFLLLLAIAPIASALEYHLNCDQCHILHSAPGSHLTYEVNSETMCMSCHDGSVSGAPEVFVHEDDDELFATCVECHKTHNDEENYEGSVNISLVRISISDNNPDDIGFNEYFNVAFDSSREFWRSSPRTDGNNGRRICQVCHTVPTFGNHPTNTDCTANCHTHANGFMRGGGGMP